MVGDTQGSITIGKHYIDTLKQVHAWQRGNGKVEICKIGDDSISMYAKQEMQY